MDRLTKTFALLLVIFMMVTVLAACNKDTVNPEISDIDSANVDDSDTNEGNGSLSNDSSIDSTSESKSDPLDVSKDQPDESNPSKDSEDSKEPIINPEVEFLSIISSTLTDLDYFVVVGKCEEGASITATTPIQTVVSKSDHGFYSVRLKKEGFQTRVKITAEGAKTEVITKDIIPKVPTADMWPIVGSNNYTFFFQKMMPDFTHSTALTGGQLNTFTNKIKNRISNLKSELPGTEIIYLIVPSKATIYPEDVPEQYTQGTGKSRLQQIYGALSEAGATVIDLQELFTSHKDDKYKIYWGTDSHWTDYSAYLTYVEVFNHISKRFPEAAPRKELEFDFVGDYYNGGDMIFYMMMDQDILQEYNHYRKPKFKLNNQIAQIPRYKSENYLMYNENTVPQQVFYTGQSKLPNLYIMRDSFGAHIYDIFPDRGNTTVYKPMWSFAYNINDIKNYSPDYIIYLLSEWNLDSLIQS